MSASDYKREYKRELEAEGWTVLTSSPPLRGGSSRLEREEKTLSLIGGLARSPLLPVGLLLGGDTCPPVDKTAFHRWNAGHGSSVPTCDAKQLPLLVWGTSLARSGTLRALVCVVALGNQSQGGSQYTAETKIILLRTV